MWLTFEYKLTPINEKQYQLFLYDTSREKSDTYKGFVHVPVYSGTVDLVDDYWYWKPEPEHVFSIEEIQKIATLIKDIK